MPTAPDLGGSEHASATAHVPESSLSSSVGPTAGDTGDTGDGTAGTPRLGGGLVTGFLGDGVGLALVLGDVGVDEVDDIGSDRGLHDVWQGNGLRGIGGHVAI